MTPHDIALLRLAAQHIVGPGGTAVADVVGRLTAMQAQDYPGVVTSIALRVAGGTRARVEAAFDAAEIVTSWPLRGTLHVVVAEDLPWLLRLAAPRMVAGAAGRRARLDLDDAALDRAREVAVGALAGGRVLRRDDLMARWDAAGLSTAGQRGYHMLWHLAQTGTVCLGPVVNGRQALVLVDEWIRTPRHLDRDEALCELALRYFRGHGPATAKDFARWAHLLAADVTAGLAVARPLLDRAVVDGVEYLLDPGTPERLDACREQARGVVLLPGFDEFILGYRDRGAVLAAEHVARIVPGGNGVFRPTVVSDGQVIGTWRHTGRGARRGVEATPFVGFPDQVADMIPAVHAALP